MKIKERIFKNWMSTILGIFGFIAAFVLVYFDKIDKVQFWEIILLSLFLMGLKDKWLGAKGTTVVIIAVLLLPSCVTRKACDKKFPVKEVKSDSVRTEIIREIKDTTIYIPGDTVTDYILIDCDSAGNVKPIKSTKKGKASSVSTRTEGNKLIVSGECPDKDITIKKQSERIRELTATSKESLKEKIVYKTPWYIWVVMSAMGLLIFFLLFLMYKIHSNAYAQHHNRY